MNEPREWARGGQNVIENIDDDNFYSEKLHLGLLCLLRVWMNRCFTYYNNIWSDCNKWLSLYILFGNTVMLSGALCTT